MKNFVIIFLIFLCSSIFSQTDTTITLTKGFEDSLGNTHLFYYTEQTKYKMDIDTTIYLYNTFDVNNKSTHQIYEGIKFTYFPGFSQSSILFDIIFYNNNPNDYIFAVNFLGIDASYEFFNSSSPYSIGGGGFSFIDILYLSPNNNNIIYAVSGWDILKSFDNGITWELFNHRPKDSTYIHFLAFSPFDESIIFGFNPEKNLVKSLDTGKTFFKVDINNNWNADSKLYFDKDKKHIYAVINESYSSEFNINTTASLIVSDDFGNPYSWETKKSFSNKMGMCIDDSVSGQIFLSVGNTIYQSNNYGNNFNIFSETINHANGLYKKPNENFLYASNSIGLLKITPDSTNYVIKKSIKNSLDLFPLAVGNKWIYNEFGTSYDIIPHPFDYFVKDEITKDSLDNKGMKYYAYERNNYLQYWIRVDSLNGNVFIKYELNDNEEFLLTALTANNGSTFNTYDGEITEIIESDTLLWDKKRLSRIYYLSSLFTYKTTYVQGIGIVEKLNSFDFGFSTTALKGCVINGILYGDTTVVGVNDNSDDIPSNFSLSQNYPNPFNPSTTIEYSIPANVKSETSNGFIPSGVEGSFVQLIVYDVLGKEVAALVNQPQKPGNYKVNFNANQLSSGIYFYQLKFGNFVETKKMILLK